MSNTRRLRDEKGNLTYLTQLQDALGRTFCVVKTTWSENKTACGFAHYENDGYSEGSHIHEKALRVAHVEQEPPDELIAYLEASGFRTKNRQKDPLSELNSDMEISYIYDAQDACWIMILEPVRAKQLVS